MVDRRTALLLVLFLQAVICHLCTVQGLLYFCHLSFQSSNLCHASGLFVLSEWYAIAMKVAHVFSSQFLFLAIGRRQLVLQLIKACMDLGQLNLVLIHLVL